MSESDVGQFSELASCESDVGQFFTSHSWSTQPAAATK